MKNKINYRKDIVSKKMFSKDEMIRIVKNKDGQIFIDKTKKASGRGVWMILTKENIEIAQSKNLIFKSLKTKIDLKIYEQLEEIV